MRKKNTLIRRWRHLVSIFIVFFGVSMVLEARASSSDNLMGWIWTDPIGWIAVNNDNPSACPLGGCGTYGVNLNLTTKKLMVGLGLIMPAGCVLAALARQSPPAVELRRPEH